MKSWGHSVNNDVATFRVMEAGRNDENFRELIEKEGEQAQENEREVVPIEELRGDRTVVFPSHAWEPRADAGEMPYRDLIEPDTLTRDEWPHQNSLWKPIVWFWKTMQWRGEYNEEDEARIGGRCTPWIYLAFDFRAATMEKMTKMGRVEGEETLASMARTFHLASRRMFQRCKCKEKHKEMKNVATMRGLDLPVCRGIDKIVVLRKPEALNRFLHELAIKMCAGMEKRSWQFKVDFPDTGLPLFHEDLPQTLRRRIEGKQARLPREKERVRPLHAVVMAAAHMEETDEARWAKMPPRLRTRDQKRVLHNRTAAEKGLHVFPPFKSMDEWSLKCLRCERDIELWTWSGQKKVFNLSARLEHSAVRRNGAVNPAIRQLQNQNNKKRSQYEKLGYATEKARLLSVQPDQCRRGSMQTTAVLVVQRTTKYDDLAHFAECRVSSNANEKPTPSPCTRRNPTSGGRSERNCARRSVQRYDVNSTTVARDTDLHHQSPDRVVH